MTERGLKNINVFYSTFTNVFLVLSRFFTFLTSFIFFSGTFFYIYESTNQLRRIKGWDATFIAALHTSQLNSFSMSEMALDIFYILHFVMYIMCIFYSLLTSYLFYSCHKLCWVDKLLIITLLVS